MRLIIPHAYNVAGGVEKVTVSLIREFEKIIESVIFILPEKNTAYFQEILTNSDNIIYESFKTRKKERDNELNDLIQKHQATHCLYTITGGQSVPKINIPFAVIVPDVYWHFSPDKYTDEFRRERDRNLEEWLKRSSIVFTISESTKKDINNIFPKFKIKLKAIPLAADVNQETFKTPQFLNNQEQVPFFFYPASHSGYQKNFITLFKAIKELVSKGLRFKVIIAGRETDKLTGNEPFSGNQDEEARMFYQKNKDIISKRIETLGFCTREKIEELYGTCRCVVLPSKYEGFGLPLIEALSRGCYAICSDIKPHKEQVDIYKCKDRVSFFPPQDEDRLAEFIEEVITIPKKRLPQEDIAERFSHWTWKDVAQDYIRCLESTT